MMAKLLKKLGRVDIGSGQIGEEYSIVETLNQSRILYQRILDVLYPVIFESEFTQSNEKQ